VFLDAEAEALVSMTMQRDRIGSFSFWVVSGATIVVWKSKCISKEREYIDRSRKQNSPKKLQP
jgi:hypothetical protein